MSSLIMSRPTWVFFTLICIFALNVAVNADDHAAFLSSDVAIEESLDYRACSSAYPATQIIAGIEAVVLRPDIEAGAATALAENTNGIFLSELDSGELASYDVGYRTWIGAQYGCVGIVARYWDYNTNVADPANSLWDTAFFGANSRTLAAFEATTTDLEVTYQRCCENAILDLSLGVRYMEMEHFLFAGAFEVNEGAVASAVANYFEGLGITGSLGGTHPICCANLKLFWNLRGSAIWGDAEVGFLNISNNTATEPIAPMRPPVVVSDPDTAWIAEAQCGVEFSAPCVCINGNSFLRVAGEFQHWRVPGDSIGSASVTSTAGGRIQSAVTTSDVRANLVGFTVTAGFER